MTDKHDPFGFNLDFDAPVDDGNFDDGFPDGQVKVIGIKKFLGLVDDGIGGKRPEFSVDKFGSRIVRFKFTLPDGEDGPPMSATMGLLTAIMKQLGYAVQHLPSGDEAAYLDLALSLAPDEPRSVIIAVKGGWVQPYLVDGSLYPDTNTLYQWKVSHFLSGSYKRQEVIRFESPVGWDGSVVNVFLEIVGDMQGNPTIYDGLQIQISMQNPFIDGIIDAEGKLGFVTSAKTNSPLKSTRRMFAFNRVFAPNCYPDRDDRTKKLRVFDRDPDTSATGVDEMLDPLHVFATEALTQNHYGIGKVFLNSKMRPSIELLDMVVAEGYGGEEPDIPEFNTPPQEVSIDRPVSVDELVGLIEKLCPGTAFAVESTSESIRFSDEGKGWMRENVTPIWAELDLPTPPQIGALSEEQASRLITAMQTAFGSSEVDEGEGWFN